MHACISVYVRAQICVCAYVCEDMPPCTDEGQMKTFGVNPHLSCLGQVILCFSVACTRLVSPGASRYYLHLLSPTAALGHRLICLVFMGVLGIQLQVPILVQ